MELFLVWMLLAVVAMFIAQSKGRNMGGWFVLGLIFGIFAVIVVAVMPEVKTSKGEAISN